MREGFAPEGGSAFMRRGEFFLDQGLSQNGHPVGFYVKMVHNFDGN